MKERKHAKASISTSKTLLEMAFFLNKKQRVGGGGMCIKKKNRAVKTGGKKAKGSM